jgi:hypothetical protein
MKISLFFQSVLKYSLAILIGGIGLSVAIWGGSEILKFQDKLAAALCMKVRIKKSPYG